MTRAGAWRCYRIYVKNAFWRKRQDTLVQPQQWGEIVKGGELSSSSSFRFLVSPKKEGKISRKILGFPKNEGKSPEKSIHVASLVESFQVGTLCGQDVQVLASNFPQKKGEKEENGTNSTFHKAFDHVYCYAMIVIVIYICK